MADLVARREQRRLMLVELNEFDPDFLSQASERLGLRRIPEVLSLTHGVTSTDDGVEHHGLDPWVQWVNVHTGKTSAEHKILRLGQTQRQTTPQIWTSLGDAGLSWGVWGVMNAPRQNDRGCQFFFPDPWSFEEEAYPRRLNELLALPRYLAKNYLDADRVKILKEALRFAGALMAPSLWQATATFSKAMIAQAVRSGVSIHMLSTFLDYLSTLVVVSLRRTTRPHFTLIFLNNIAHLQHQFWRRGDTIHPEMEIGLRLTDRMLGLLLDDLAPNEAMIVMNGLKQKNVEGEGFCVYRQKNPQRMMGQFGLPGVVEQCMTHDAHVLCSSKEDADRVESVLQSCRLSSAARPAFYVERVADLAVFYQIDFDHEIAPDEAFLVGNQKLPASELIELYARRTGAHIPNADIYSTGIDLPEAMPNHQVFSHVLRYFSGEAATTRDAKLAVPVQA